MAVIRFPTTARFGMATALPWYRLLWRKWFGHHRRTVGRNSIRFDRARRGL